MEKIDSKMALE